MLRYNPETMEWEEGPEDPSLLRAQQEALKTGGDYKEAPVQQPPATTTTQVETQSYIVTSAPRGSFKQIWVTFQKVGYHRYPQAATDPSLADVSYLGTVHRHLFKFKVAIEVFHDDREIEFHQFLKFCEQIVQNEGMLDHKSCEMISDDLAGVIKNRFPNRALTIEVSEDGECGSLISYER